ncbi:MAG: O-acetyl-ADP-ribose deacetylase [Candidatus Neomarinimicrobiota bacterium]
MSKIGITRGDITEQAVDAIVNAANNSLLGGGGVDGAIHRAAGPGLIAECRLIGGCPTGEGRVTKGYRLKARYIIHTVGPVWQGGQAGEPEALRSCYRNCLALAKQYSIRTIAFPAISTGAYGYPAEAAAAIALTEISNHLDIDNNIDCIKIICFSKSVFDAYTNRYNVLKSGED